MIVAVTGGTGFVGGHLLAAATAHGHTVRALARRPQPPLPKVEWITGDLANPGALCDGADAVIHIAGTITATSRAEFDAGNVAGTASIIAATRAAGVRRFVHVSSLAAREPGLSDYGASKAAAEALVAASGLDWAIVRPPGVYGPGDRETLPVFQMVARGIAVLPGDGRFSLIEVGDLSAALLALAASDAGGIAEIDDGHEAYSHADLARAIGMAVGRFPIRLRLPLAVLRATATIETTLARIQKRGPRMTHDRARYLAHPDWVAATARGLPATLWQPKVPLAEGLARAVAWYRANGWLAAARL
ncbi:NAD(P)H-binding protein [Polymorphobacter sp. PAMC 29334]|uniref:NAD-dependent epimerase/dehydratase family protein n=1 Tax=Polymorphobacter sp. PAMC 29334 TaxID=2862331 RepID=UPI001C75E7C4|nr:NAD-dependent epimerase/dehydratase family protein [Polymorphobacter sp. PAMC 29334]QYE33728.1 NAD(P)H-binding protein [Polymorphobacter sp. PAMC 29334]